MLTSKTVSTCTPETAQGTHVFDIFGYSQHRGIGVGKYIRSGGFSAGGHDCSIVLFPDGVKTDSDCISIFLQLNGNGAAKVRASYDLRLRNQTTGLLSTARKRTMEFDRAGQIATLLYTKRSVFEKSPYLRDDRLTIHCTVTVFKEPRVSETKPFPEIEVPPSDLSQHLCELLHEKEGTDVTFSVGGDTFEAHKIVLAMRSPVFRAEFFGPMREAMARFVTIRDMHPAVFRALLHFIYTDSFPAAMDDHEGDIDNNGMIGHLLVAADRYAMERLKLVCQSILCKNLSVETVATTLAIADQHNCDRLKDACLQFISCSNAMDDVVATQGYKNLKRDCPSVIVDVLEKIKKCRKT
ncbi:unnamed protein product [Alopecurus aequalis]